MIHLDWPQDEGPPGPINDPPKRPFLRRLFTRAQEVWEQSSPLLRLVWLLLSGLIGIVVQQLLNHIVTHFIWPPVHDYIQAEIIRRGWQ